MSNKLQAYIYIGAPASGKSYYKDNFIKAEKLEGKSYTVLERDELRKQICSRENPNLDIKKNFQEVFYSLSKSEINTIETEITTFIDTTIKSKTNNLILSNTNLSKKYRNKLINTLKENGYEIFIKVFNPPLELLLNRNVYRKDSVDVGVLVNMYQKLQVEINQGLLNNPNTFLKTPPFSNAISDKCILVDLDGTIAHIKDNYRTHYDKDCSKDIFDEMVFHMAYSLSLKYQADLVFLTGRNTGSWESSKAWLETHVGKHSKYKLEGIQLYSRFSRDYRPDTEAKKDLYDNFIIPNYKEVLCVFDDRPSMVNMWNDLGLKVIALGDQRIDF